MSETVILKWDDGTGDVFVTERTTDSLSTSLRHAIEGHRNVISGCVLEMAAHIVVPFATRPDWGMGSGAPEIVEAETQFFEAADTYLKAIKKWRESP